MSTLRKVARRWFNASVDDSLLLNLSYVLHERSDSAAVRALAAGCRSHAAWLNQSPTLPIATVEGAIDTAIDIWLTATIGLHRDLPDALQGAYAQNAEILRIDEPSASMTTTSFFRADAAISLPPVAGATIGVAGLVARPGRTDAHLVIAGPFQWPNQQRAAIRALERLIQQHVDQWMPPHALWQAPAEKLLPGEVA